MRQHDIGNPVFTPAGTLPRPGQRFPDLFLVNAKGRGVHVSDFRGQKKLVIALQPSADLLSAKAEFAEHDAVLLLIPSKSEDVLHALGLAPGSAPQCAVFITDQFAEIAAVWPNASHPQMPAPSEVIEWLEYLDHVCPECEPPEWPAGEL